MSKDERVILGEHGYKSLSRFSPKNEALKKLFGKGKPVVIADKENEYASIAAALGGEVITLSKSPTNFCINPLTDLPDATDKSSQQEYYLVTGPGKEEFIEKMQNFTPSIISNVERREDYILFTTMSISCVSPAETNNILHSYIELLRSMSGSIQIQKVDKKGDKHI